MRIVRLDETSRKNILADLLKRDPNQYGTYADAVQDIIDTVKRDRDKAVLHIPGNLIMRISILPTSE